MSDMRKLLEAIDSNSPNQQVKRGRTPTPKHFEKIVSALEAAGLEVSGVTSVGGRKGVEFKVGKIHFFARQIFPSGHNDL